MIYSKTLELEDYAYLPESKLIHKMKQRLDGVAGYRFEHPHRAWEYGIILNALVKNNSKCIIDVGGGGSLFAPLATSLGIKVLQIDPEDYSKWAGEQSAVLKEPLPYLLMDFFEYQTDEEFDAVTSISVLEHIPNDIGFFQRLCAFVKPGGLLAMTVDFHPSGAVRVDGHLRTYNNNSIENLISIAKEVGFELYGGTSKYNYQQEHVNNYTFASMIFSRSES